MLAPLDSSALRRPVEEASRAGIPTVVCGPAGGGLHAADEWVDLHQVRRYTLALIEAATTWGASA